ncbi:protein of unknown function DUF1214 [Parvibaculum lavamentivorans DS-1]|uniref:DUF1214 domain-containing protein n=1 Tax=Parvibaculum lavamentivorans (strain DS-1 / DSM 13023 / NCIMB 13966) TaxID=402881 RepID=A7HRC9_PARL1|nr:DUF1214 domain-containing protein [Parvibaculum lavamentivorans]ABS62462.1 protein of unknown function DUF1214 [Parvibaculum lavamentivorans DS-1]
MKTLIYWGSALAAALVLALGTAWWFVNDYGGTYRSGAWTTSTAYGSVEADMYTRARVALFGLLALDKRETMYYQTRTDSAGEPLSGNCTYRLEGSDLAAHWWSITAYDADSFLIPNERNVFSFSQTTTAREPDGSFVIRISPDPQEKNWLPVKAGEGFDLTARFYNPQASIYADPAAAVLPIIAKETCR